MMRGSGTPVKVLLVDDERLLVKGLKFNLEHEGYEVSCCYDGESAIRLARESAFDLIILDLMMPEVDGLEACRRIREFSTVPIIMLTARSEDTDKLIGFEYGADDYVTKPFNIMELKARIRAILRRVVVQNQQAPPAETLQLGNITLDISRHNASVDGRTVELTAKEFDLVEFLMRNPGRVYTRESLLDTVWGYEYPGDIRTVDVHIRRLREKLEVSPAKPKYLLTKWGVGYFFRRP
jgi:DNA-binding response OmpR family regulator